MEYCADPQTLEGINWWVCYLTNGKHLAFYQSFIIVILLIMAVIPFALCFGFLGAISRRSSFLLINFFGKIYTNMVRGVPDIIFFLFFPLALDQGIEIIRHYTLCADVTAPIYQGNDFIVCQNAKMPLSSTPQIYHNIYNFILAVIAFSVVFGAFAANILYGAIGMVPKGQIEAATAHGMSSKKIFQRIIVPQMWIYALPGLSNLLMILIKATPLLFLLGIPDIVYWARELGGTKTAIFDYPHGDWRVWYFLSLLLFYLLLTWGIENIYAKIENRLHKKMGMALSSEMENANA